MFCTTFPSSLFLPAVSHFLGRVSTSVDNPPTSAWKAFKGPEPAPFLAVVGVELEDNGGEASHKRRSSYAEAIRRRSSVTVSKRVAVLETKGSDTAYDVEASATAKVHRVEVTALATSAIAATSSSDWITTFDRLLRACNEEQREYLKSALGST